MARDCIIIVEDEIIIASDIKRSLESRGYEIPAIAKRGEDAIEAVRKYSPDLVLMDILLAGPMDGIEAARRIRKFIDVPIIYMTANADDITVSGARDTEPYAYLNKPVQERDLFTNIDSALHRHRTEKRLRTSEERYRGLIESIPDIIISLDDSAVITYISPPAEALSGYPVSEIVGKPFTQFMVPALIPQAMSAYEKLRAGENTSNEYNILTKNGIDLWVRATSRPIFVNDKFVGITSILTNITEEKRSHEELTLRHEQLRFAMDEIARSNKDLIAANRKLEEREHEYHSLFTFMLEGSAIHTIVTDDEGTPRDYIIDNVNPMFEKMTGLKFEDVAGKPATLVYASNPPPYLDQYARVALTGESEQFETLYSPLSKHFRISVYSPAVRRFVTTFEDITLRKRDEEIIAASLREKEILIREIHHRVKNNFQLILSMLTLQERHITSDPLTQEFLEAKNRIRAMALVHEKLYGTGDLTRIDLPSYLQVIIRELLASYPRTGMNATLELALQPVELAIGQAVPVGLIINEILTNTLKFAFTPGFAGRPVIRVDMRTGEGNTISISIGDNGVGMPESVNPDTAGTLGLNMVSMLAQQLGAQISFDRTGGTRFTLTFKLA